MDVHRISLHRNIFKEEPIMCFSKFWVSLALTVMFVKQLNPICINLSCRQFAARCHIRYYATKRLKETMSTMCNFSNFLLEHKLGNFQCRMEKHLPRLPEKWTTLRATPKFSNFFFTVNFCSFWFASQNFRNFTTFWYSVKFPRIFLCHFPTILKALGFWLNGKYPILSSLSWINYCFAAIS